MRFDPLQFLAGFLAAFTIESISQGEWVRFAAELTALFMMLMLGDFEMRTTKKKKRRARR